jgi:transcriptional regulator with XRE-family HTH domain
MGNDELGRLVRAARQRRKWSILYTAEVCNVSKTQLQLIETARSDQSPKLRTIESLIKGLELSAPEANQLRKAAGIALVDSSDHAYDARLTEQEKGLLDIYRSLDPEFAVELDRSAQALKNLQAIKKS